MVGVGGRPEMKVAWSNELERNATHRINMEKMHAAALKCQALMKR